MPRACRDVFDTPLPKQRPSAHRAMRPLRLAGALQPSRAPAGGRVARPSSTLDVSENSQRRRSITAIFEVPVSHVSYEQLRS